MATCAIRITLLEPVIASHDVATAAAPSTLPYLPGAMIWGLLASRGYGSKTADQVLAAFYGSGLVVDDALLSAGGSVALPAPLSLHRLKDQSIPSSWQDWSDGNHAAGYSQAKERQIAPGSKPEELAEVRPHTFDTQRTAIDPDALRASDGQFFGMQALAEGQVFVGQISGPKDLVDAAVAELDGKEHMLGKSRNAEFGRVRFEVSALPSMPATGTGTGTILWCLSDLAALDRYHQPSERPDTGFFGDGVEIDWSKSFVRHRSYSPFNTKWKTRQPERLVITRGSVIVLRSALPCGEARFGLYQEQGLGRVLVCDRAPLDLLTSWAPTGTSTIPTEGAAKSRLAYWLTAQTERHKERGRQASVAMDAWNVWRPHYIAAEQIQGERCGPTPSQLGALVNTPDPVKIRSFLTDALGATGERENRSWKARYAAGEGHKGTFAQGFLDVLDEGLSALASEDARKAQEARNAESLRRIAHSLRRYLDEKGWFDGR